MKKPAFTASLKIVPIHAQPQYIDMSKSGIVYIHGSNSHSFVGLVRFRALLSMEEMDGTPWFHRHGLHSGERGYTITNLYRKQPVSQGVSLNNLSGYGDSLHYASLGCGTGAYPVLYGLDGAVSLSDKCLDHPVSWRGIGIDHVKAIYVPVDRQQEARHALATIPRLAQIIRPLQCNLAPA